MRPSKLFIIVVILLETLTVFCLGILSNQISNLFTLPVPLLLLLAASGITGMTLITYFRYSHASDKVDRPPTTDKLTIGEIWRRLKPRKRHKYLFVPTRTRHIEDLISETFLVITIGVGLWLPFMWEFFPQLKLTWHRLIIFGLICLLSIPIVAIFTPEKRLAYKLSDSIALVFFFVAFLLAGIVYGYVFLYIFILIRWLIHLFI